MSQKPHQPTDNGIGQPLSESIEALARLANQMAGSLAAHAAATKAQTAAKDASTTSMNNYSKK